MGNWINKPPLGSQLDYSNPLSQGLVEAYLYNENAGNTPKSLIKIQNGTGFGGVVNWQSTIKGIGLNFNQGYLDNRFLPNLQGKSFTIIVYAKANTGANYHALYNRGNIPVTRLIDLSLQGTPEANTGYLTFQLYDGTNNPFVRSSVDYRNAWHQFVGVKKPSGAGGLTIYVDGVNKGNTATYTIGTYENSADAITFGYRVDYGTTKYFVGQMLYVYVYSRALSPSEIMSLYIAPYQMIYKPSNRFYFTPAAGGGNYKMKSMTIIES